jgi:hypothetical protein
MIALVVERAIVVLPGVGPDLIGPRELSRDVAHQEFT